jgi:sugar phosphate isomerase/epimerase
MHRYQELASDVRKLGDMLMTLHLSDYDGVDEKHWLPGRGVIDWKTFMEALRNIDYVGPLNYECQIDGETLQARIRSLEDNFEWLCNL